MDDLEIRRFAYFPDRTIGIATFGDRSWYTIENPWLENRVNLSCIPEDCYQMVRVNSPKYGPDTWEIANVPGRTHILIHKANWANDVLGCVGFGMGLFDNLEGVTNSARAVGAFYEETVNLDTLKVRVCSGIIDYNAPVKA